jgi:phosphomannomutase
MKFVRQGARPVSGDSGLWAIRERVLAGPTPGRRSRGGLERREFRDQYIEHLLSYVDVGRLAPLVILANPGNGCAGPVMRRLEQRLPFDLRLIQEEPDGRFPNGVPNPLLPERRGDTAEAVASCGADLGLAWDGDFDRCFFFDASGALVEGYYLVGLLAQVFLQSHPGERILHDPRLVWNTRDAVLRAGGIPVQCKTGHAFIKERMRSENAVYGGEMSAHHYFRDFAFCDSGMIPWLVVAQLVSQSGKPLAQLVGDCLAAYPCSGEINYAVEHPALAMRAVRDHFTSQAPQVDETDGLGLEFADWRMNLRTSNTEPLLRLNVESRGNMALVRERVEEIGRVIGAVRPGTN